MAKIMTKAIENKLKKNYEKNQEAEGSLDFKPELKLFGGSACTWLISEYDEESQLFFGLADLGMGFPEMGWISKQELESVRFPPFNLPIERDRYFSPEKKLAEYAKEAKEAQRIVS